MVNAWSYRTTYANSNRRHQFFFSVQRKYNHGIAAVDVEEEAAKAILNGNFILIK